jgi:hypothetical protein
VLLLPEYLKLSCYYIAIPADASWEVTFHYTSMVLCSKRLIDEKERGERWKEVFWPQD